MEGDDAMMYIFPATQCQRVYSSLSVAGELVADHGRVIIPKIWCGSHLEVEEY